jgi:hypothetical protein
VLLYALRQTSMQCPSCGCVFNPGSSRLRPADAGPPHPIHGQEPTQFPYDAPGSAYMVPRATHLAHREYLPTAPHTNQVIHGHSGGWYGGDAPHRYPPHLTIQPQPPQLVYRQPRMHGPERPFIQPHYNIEIPGRPARPPREYGPDLEAGGAEPEEASILKSILRWMGIFRSGS